MHVYSKFVISNFFFYLFISILNTHSCDDCVWKQGVHSATQR